MVNAVSVNALAAVCILWTCTSCEGCHKQTTSKTTTAERREQLRGLTVSPDGTKIAFVRQVRSGKTFSRSVLVVVDLRSKKVNQQTTLPGLFVEAWYGMSWSPDGKWLALSAYEKSGTSWGIWRFMISDGKVVKLSVVKDRLLQRPLVSPDGASVLFRAAHRGDLAIHAKGARKLRFITSSGTVARQGFDFGPNGSYIYYGRGTPKGIWRIRPDGKGKTLIRGSEKFLPQSLRVSSSGKHIAFVDEHSTLFVSPLPDFAPKKVSESVGYDIRWSPTSDELVYGRFDTKTYADKPLRIWSAKAGKKLHQQLVGRRPVWARRGQAVLFLTSSEHEIWSYDFKSRRRERVFPK